jgi:hypothetical protein
MKHTLLTISGIALLTSIPAFSQTSERAAKKYQFEFVKVVDSTQGFSSFQTFPAINNHSEVTFVAIRSHYGEGVFRARAERETVTTIASSLDGLTLFGGDVAMNTSGVVAFSATTASGSRAIFKGDGNSRTLIADSVRDQLIKIFIGSPSINAFGTVAFASPHTGIGFPASVFVGNGGPLTAIASTSTPGFRTFQNVAINDSGTVVIEGGRTDGSSDMFTVQGNVLTDLVNTDQHPEFFGFGDLVINYAGTIADFAYLSTTTEIITANTRGITPRNDPATPTLANSEHPSINNQGAVAFQALPNAPGDGTLAGIFIEVSGGHSLIPVIAPGDPLFGSTVVKATLGRFALNDRFQMAFSYVLADGRSGVAIASFDGEREGEDQ